MSCRHAKIAYMIRRGQHCAQRHPALRITSGLLCWSGVNVDPDCARLTVAQAAVYFGLSKAVINGWYVRGHLTDVEHDAKGQRLYLLRQLLDAEYNTRRHPNSSRSPQRRTLALA